MKLTVSKFFERSNTLTHCLSRFKTYVGHGKNAVKASFCVVVLCAATAASAQTLTSNSTGTHNGFYYSFWKDNGDASFQLLEGGRYKSQWSNSNNWVGGKGWNPGSNNKIVSYSGSYSVDNAQNSYLALYGWTRNPLIEYYVIESYGSYNPSSCSGGQNFGSFQSDGGTYSVRRCQRVNQPSIDGTATFYQYFSVRSPKKGFGSISGTITVANHFNYWASNGLNLGSHNYMVLATEGYQSRGSSDITVSEGVVATTSSVAGTSSAGSSDGDIVVRMKGTLGSESVTLYIGASAIKTWTLSSSMQNYGVTTNAVGEVRVEFTNDSGDLDVQVDYVSVDGDIRQAEDQQENTGVYDGSCGGGSYSEMLHCNGYISFGNRNGVTVSSSSSDLPSISSSIAISSASSADIQVGTCIEMCEWYQDAPRPLCVNQDSGWGWENQQSCIGRDTCNNQSGDGGVINVCDGPTSLSSRSSSTSSRPVLSSSQSSAASSRSADTSVHLIVAVNAGGQAAIYDGIDYQADRYAAGGTASTTADPISGVTEDTLFQSERYGSYSYRIPVTAGTYTIELQFAEIYHNSAGQRSFSVSVEDQVEMSDVDLYTLAGHDGAYRYQISNIRVSDGSLDIAVQTLVDNGTLAGFAVYSNDGSLLSASSSRSSVSSVGNPATSGVKSIQVDGTERQFYLHVPAAYSGSTSVPLLLDFHGIFGSGSGQMGSSGYREVADQEGFIVAYPDGIDQAWNVGPCCTLDRNVDDVAFARAIVNTVKSQANINPSRVYATGFSMGGGMTHYLGCHAADLFAALAPNAFDLLEENVNSCSPSRPIPLIMTRGTSDSIVPYNGGASQPPNGLDTIHFLGAQSTFNTWSQLNGCSSTTSTDANGCTVHAQCSSNVSVSLCTIQGGAHAPGNAQTSWNFMKNYTLP